MLTLSLARRNCSEKRDADDEDNEGWGDDDDDDWDDKPVRSAYATILHV
jgi:hypothetical protein